MATAVGVDLGTTNSVIAATEAAKPAARVPSEDQTATGLRLHPLRAVEHHSGEVHPTWLRAVREGSLQGTGIGLAILRRGVDLLRPVQVRDGRVERGWICRGVVADDDGVVARHCFQAL